MGEIDLARVLHYEMEKLDPTDDPDWDQMSDHRREFYVLCVRSLIKSSEFQAVYQRKPAAT